LEQGTTFNGSDIVSTLTSGDQLPIPQDLFTETRIVSVNLVAINKNNDTAIVLTHYIDGRTDGKDYSFSDSDVDISYRYANVVQDIFSAPGIFHGFKLVKATRNEVKGFEPLYFALYYTRERER